MKKDKHKIAVIGAKGFPAWGGAARANENIFMRLKNKYDVTNYAISSHAKIHDYHGIKQIIFGAYKNKKISTLMYYIKSMSHALLKGDYDIVHVNHIGAAFMVPILKLRFPVALNIRGLIYNQDDKWKYYEKKLFSLFQWVGCHFADKIITVEKSSVPILEKYNPSNVIYIPNGVDSNTTNAGSAEPCKYDITFSAARIIYLKGLHLLLSALNSMSFKGKIQIIGDIDQVTEYKNKILELANNLNCEFTGLVQDKLELFEKISQSRIFVFPSYSEGMSNMLLEVASLKVPIIASDIIQNRDVFNDDEVLFFKIGNIEDLVIKIKYAFENNSIMEEMSEKAYNKLIVDYDWDSLSNQYDAVYETVLNNT